MPNLLRSVRPVRWLFPCKAVLFLQAIGLCPTPHFSAAASVRPLGNVPPGRYGPFEKVDETFSPLRAKGKTKGTAFAVPSAYGGNHKIK